MTVSAQQLQDWVEDARARTFAMVSDLDDVRLSVPYLPIVNPFLWELGHGIWFQEHWVLRNALGGSPLLEAMTPRFEGGDYLAPDGPGFGTGLTEAMVLDHRLEPR